MKCKKCKKSYNSIRWYVIYVNGIYNSNGGDASKPKRDIAIWMKREKGWKKDKIEYRSFNHCFECGHENNLENEIIE